MPKWFGERPGKKSGDPDSPDEVCSKPFDPNNSLLFQPNLKNSIYLQDEDGGAEAAPVDDYVEEEEEEEEEVILL